MKGRIIFIALLLLTFAVIAAQAQKLPLVYSMENTGWYFPPPQFPAFNDLPVLTSLPDPLKWADSTGRITFKSDWRRRRAEIGAQIQHYEIGIKPPRPDSITASFSMSDSILHVYVTVGTHTLALTSKINVPPGPGPYPAVIGMNSPSGSIPSSVFTSRNIARIPFYHNQVTTYGGPQTSDPYYQLYPSLNPTNTGQYSAWAWGVSRLIDGLELVQDSLPIDLRHIAVTGCSYAGKLALFAGAFDERIALTLAMESGGGGATSWRYSQSETPGTVEMIDNTDYNWFADSMKQFSGTNVWKMPEDHHELMAMVAPRALYVTGNPDYTWLSNPSCDVCSRACERVYNALGIGDRFGFSVEGGHTHCSVPSDQIADIGLMVDKFILGKDSLSTAYVVTSPYHFDTSGWITFSPTLIADNPTSVGKDDQVIHKYDLRQNFPNPFNPTTTIRFSVPQASRVDLKIYNALGQLVRTLVDNFKSAGTYSVQWDGKDSAGKAVPSGAYFYRIASSQFTSAKKMIYMK